ncbi:MAG: hypothetical protein ABII00_15390 [Elusimicrobiota bacterium]
MNIRVLIRLLRGLTFPALAAAALAIMPGTIAHAAMAKVVPIQPGGAVAGIGSAAGAAAIGSIGASQFRLGAGASKANLLGSSLIRIAAPNVVSPAPLRSALPATLRSGAPTASAASAPIGESPAADARKAPGAGTIASLKGLTRRIEAAKSNNPGANKSGAAGRTSSLNRFWDGSSRYSASSGLGLVEALLRAERYKAERDSKLRKAKESAKAAQEREIRIRLDRDLNGGLIREMIERSFPGFRRWTYVFEQEKSRNSGANIVVHMPADAKAEDLARGIRNLAKQAEVVRVSAGSDVAGYARKAAPATPASDNAGIGSIVKRIWRVISGFLS